MKLPLNKATYAQMPEPVRALVQEWQRQHRKRHISVETTPQFYAPEDARVTVVNLLTGKTGSAQAAGEFAGFTKLSPCDPVPLPEGCTAVVTYFFCGTPMCTVYQGGPKPPLKLSGTLVEVGPVTRGGFGCNMNYKP